MNSASHILMGRLVRQYVQEHYGIGLDERNFLLGNVLPDYLPSFLTRPHFLRYNAGHVRKLMRNLISGLSSPEKKTPKRSRHSLALGVICHFYTDFFCYAHSPYFRQGLRKHAEYEERLDQYFKQSIEKLCRLSVIIPAAQYSCVQDIYARFEKLQSSYRAAERAFSSDLVYAFYACVDVIVALTGCAAAQAQKPMPLRAARLKAV